MRDNKESRTQLSTVGCRGHGHVLLALQTLSIMLLAGILVVILVQGSRIHRSQGKESVNQELEHLKAAVRHLCRPCPWEWTFFQGNCYFFSKSQRTWNDSITACQEEGAQLVIIRSYEEQRFLKDQTSTMKLFTWMGLSDLKHEGIWEWVDGSSLSKSFWKYWNDGEPNNEENEDCVEFMYGGWNDARCELENFWVCKKSAASCPDE